MRRYFNFEEMRIVGQSFYKAERIVCDFYRLKHHEMKTLQYDVCTLAFLKKDEFKEDVFAHLCRYEYVNGYFYRICIHDHRILDAVARGHSFIKFAPLMLYIAAHELVHIVRFYRGEANFDVPFEERKREEQIVHRITGDLLCPYVDSEMRLILDCFSENYALI
ncbi:MAG: hypothetical protein N2317_04810 [Syntrophales bacterium]|nr:hypothetical protein [Syntrophales bacterium]